MQRNRVSQAVLTDNQLLLYISDQSPTEDWQAFATSYHGELLHHSDLLTALGAFIMLMPGIVVIDRRSAVGNESVFHIEDVLHATPQPTLIIIELGVPDCAMQSGSVVRLGTAADVPPMQILTRLEELSQEA